ncbi:MAG: hypothetical protein QF464_09535 [Myxococcota bacterium]|nr:hypothetical protein [Myxococcota bacterium]
MKTRTIKIILIALSGAILLPSPALACMEHDEDWYYEEEPTEEVDEPAPEPVAPVAVVEPFIECDQDMACPSGMLCEPVECCMAEDCVCPAGMCETPTTGAQGRDCQADADCGDGFGCVTETIESCGDALGVAAEDCRTSPLGWCEASVADDVVPEIQDLGDALRDVEGCQGGQDHGLPLSVALAVLLSAIMRRRQLV